MVERLHTDSVDKLDSQCKKLKEPLVWKSFVIPSVFLLRQRIHSHREPFGASTTCAGIVLSPASSAHLQSVWFYTFSLSGIHCTCALKNALNETRAVAIVRTYETGFIQKTNYDWNLLSREPRTYFDLHSYSAGGVNVHLQKETNMRVEWSAYTDCNGMRFSLDI